LPYGEPAGLTKKHLLCYSRRAMFLSALIPGSCEVRIAHAMPLSGFMR
jgi:hypothetical protein